METVIVLTPAQYQDAMNKTVDNFFSFVKTVGKWGMISFGVIAGVAVIDTIIDKFKKPVEVDDKELQENLEEFLKEKK